MPYDVWSGVCLSGLEVRLRRLNLDRDSSICLQVGDEDSRHEGVEIERSSPFHLSRILAKEFGYRSVSCDLDQNIAKGTTDPGVDCFDQLFWFWRFGSVCLIG